MSTAIFPPGPVSRSPLGQLFQFVRNPLHFLTAISDQYGDLVHFNIRKRDVFLVSRPEDIEGILVTNARRFVKNPGFQNIKRVLGEGLLSSEGEFHLRQRRMIQPAFHRQRVQTYALIMVEEAQRMSEQWSTRRQTDVFEDMQEVALRIVSRAMFSAELGAYTSQVRQAVDDAMSLFQQATSPLSLVLARIPGLGDRRLQRGKAHLDGVLLHLIRSWQASDHAPDDLLTNLLQAQEAGSSMPEQQVRDEILTILTAGHETSATALAWTWRLLAQSPHACTTLQAELDEVLEGRAPGVDDLPRLVYTRQVLMEALRIYPPIFMVGRQALQEHPVQNYHIPAGASIIISPYIVHHNPQYYPEPERFDPDRWLPEARIGMHKLTYLPFGAGPRGCIGEPFAWQEMLLVLATLAQRWQPRLVPGAVIETLPRVTLRPKGGLPMLLEERSRSA